MKLTGIIALIIVVTIALLYLIGHKNQKEVIGNIENTKNEFMKYGKTVSEVLSHRGEVDDWKLDANIGLILLNKEEKKGLDSFTDPERYIYVIEGMMREVNNGGFNQFFFNSSGYLAFDLIPALESINSIEAKEIAHRALKIFGEPSSLDRDQRITHLKKITKNFELEPWNKCDDDFYNLSEPIEKLMIDYIEENINEFVS